MLPSFLLHETTKHYLPNTDILFLLNTDCTDNTDAGVSLSVSGICGKNNYT